MSLISDLLPVIDELYALSDAFGLQQYSVTLRIVTYAGDRAGVGASTVTETPITVGGGARPTVEEVRDDDVVAGSIAKTRYRIGPLVPKYEGGGYSADTLDPPKQAQPAEVFFVIKGEGLPPGGDLCKKVGDDFGTAYEYFVTVESLGQEG